MTPKLDDAIREWLAAEGTDTERAEAALNRALARFDRRGPRDGFVERVMMASGKRTPARQVWWPRTIRTALAACLLVAGLALLNLPVLVAAWAPIVRAIGVWAIGPLLHNLSRVIDAAFAAWSMVVDVASVLRASLTDSVVMAVLVVNLLVATACLAGLKHLLKTSEELLPW